MKIRNNKNVRTIASKPMEPKNFTSMLLKSIERADHELNFRYRKLYMKTKNPVRFIDARKRSDILSLIQWFQSRTKFTKEFYRMEFVKHFFLKRDRLPEIKITIKKEKTNG